MRLLTKASKMYTLNPCGKKKLNLSGCYQYCRKGGRPGKKAGSLNALPGNQNAPAIIAASMLIPDRRKIIRRDSGGVTTGRYPLNQQKSRVHEISKTRRVAALAMYRHLPCQ
jgi:hypothetical protein